MNAATRSGIQVASVSDQLSKFLHDIELPGLDVNKALSDRAKDVEAFTTAMKIATDGADTVAQRQSEMLQAILDRTAAAIRELSTSGSLKETAAMHSELVGSALKAAVANACELTAMIEKSNEEAFNSINRRMKDSLEEIRRVALKKFR